MSYTIRNDHNFHGPSTSSELAVDLMMRGRIIDGRRYLGNNCWEVVNHEESRTNERREGAKP
jgi:hypothetical protein